ncbi:alpha/beta hydrolase-fold protein [Terrabacter sp. NPDC000476]|uniref:alpha/beta hydrolase n=1 Tax=Terrabacter sp. NPDC000476 TaxID=3154258 RepID=UPI00331C65B3
MNRIDLLSGALPTVLLALAAVAVLVLVVGLRRRLFVFLPATVVAAVLLTLLFRYVAEDVWELWEPTDAELYYAIGAGTLGVLLGLAQLVAGHGWVQRSAGLACAVVIAVAAGGFVNIHFGSYPTIGSLFGDVTVRIFGLPPPAAISARAVTERTWAPPDDMPEAGRISRVHIPAARSRYAAGAAYVYLPPAYLSSRRPELPVLVLLHGDPGSSLDWVNKGVQDQLDAFARSHHGLAPIVIMPDLSGDGGRVPLCLDSDVGRSATYLAEDVPRWAQRVLGAGRSGARQWAIAGFSYGGTCSVQLAVNHPTTYPTFLDLLGEDRPASHKSISTIANEYFGGKASRFSEQNALDVLGSGRRSYEGSAGVVVVGADDENYGDEGRRIHTALVAAGVDARLEVVPGSHTWNTWQPALTDNLPWVATRLGLL